MGKNLDLMKKMAREYDAAVVEGGIDLLAQVVVAANEAAPVKTGELKTSMAFSLNNKVMSRTKRGRRGAILRKGQIVSKLRALRPRIGDTPTANWIARHANIIDGGRRKDRRGRFIGSEDAPRGFVKPLVKRVRSFRVRIRRIRGIR